VDFRLQEWFERHMSDAMRDDRDPAGWRLGCDRFTMIVIQAELTRLVVTGWLAERGNDDSYDYRLTLPPS
jgi:hypothetical protein